MLMCISVTMQIGISLHVALIYDSMIFVEGKRFSFFFFSFGNRFLLAVTWPGLRALLLRSSMSLRTSLTSQKATRQNHVQKFFMSLSVHQPVSQTDLHPLWKVHGGFQSPNALAAALSFRIWRTALSLHVAVQDPCTSAHPGSRARGPEHPSAQNPETELSSSYKARKSQIPKPKQ